MQTIEFETNKRNISTNSGERSCMPVTYEEIQSIVRIGLSSPSGDNIQPWRFTWNDQTLAVFYENHLGEHALNNNFHATGLSLGCLLEAIKIGASGFFLSVNETISIKYEKEKPVAILTFSRNLKKTDFLVSEVFRRKTVRFPLLTTPPTKMILELLKGEAFEYKNCELSFCLDKNQQMLNYLKFCDEVLWKNKKILIDFLKWIRLSDRELEQSFDGMPWQTLGIKNSDIWPLRLIRRLPFLVSLLWHFGFKKQVNAVTSKLFYGQSLLYCISIKTDSNDTPYALHIIEAGRLSYRLWLLLQSENYGVQPLSMVSMTAFDVITGHKPPGLDQKSCERFNQGYQTLKTVFSVSPNSMPIWTFRAGSLPKNLEIPVSPRVKAYERLKVYTRG